MTHPTDTTTTRKPTSQAALTAFALERIAAQLLAVMEHAKTEEAAWVIHEAALEIWAHSDALLHAATDADIARLTGANARVVR